ncbi:uncharacterized protein EMH_0067890 [Eimeria mitis]|uniref:Peptidase M16 C-terminal domain-containing protein n=1 Tax=Eimeria mitis TaxID=44415 RepID=U6K1K2_9EIME|nr:uncharacterized protein EMH_0067890 [Eimeria mitis]CDJ31564.1 hypothetical protein EMH_0067890 [Eimeria mitis]
MTAVIVGGETLDKLQEIAVSFLSLIPNKNTEPPKYKECTYTQQPFAPDELKTLVRFTLTEEGAKDESIALIGDLFFLYLRAIRLLGVEEWRYKELAAIRRQQFLYADMLDAYTLTQEAAEGKQQQQQQQQQ